MSLYTTLFFFAFSLLNVSGQYGFSQKGDSLPPVSIAVDLSAFELRPELGGVYDRTRGIVWGYSLLQMLNSGAPFEWANSTYAPNYANYIWQAGDRLQLVDPIGAEKCYQASVAAAQYTNWRMPTLNEARDAVSRGLFTYGQSGLNLWTGSPADLTFGLPYGDGRSTWTSTLESKGKGNRRAWVFGPRDGGAYVTALTSQVDIILVRTYTGP